MSDSIESKYRSDSFVGGVPVTLANGETFHFEPPRVQGVYPAFAPDGRIMQQAITQFGPEWDRMDEELRVKCQSDAQINVWGYAAWFADRMLCHSNYKKEIREEYRHILVYNDQTSGMWRDVLDIARGFDPKGLTSVGSKPSSGPTESIPGG